MDYLLICLAALLGSALTFFSGFGLGTLLLPVFAIFFPIKIAVALTAVVHFLNNLFKLSLVASHVEKRVLFTFGVPAAAAAFVGAGLLAGLSNLEPLYQYSLAGRTFTMEPVKVVIGTLMIAFSLFEIIPAFNSWTVASRYMPIGGILSGFFGGLSGHQGALRSAFLVRSGLSKESFIATGVMIAVMIDIVRLFTYGMTFQAALSQENVLLLTAATASAFIGAFLGNRFLKKITMKNIQQLVAVMLFIIAGLTIAGLI